MGLSDKFFEAVQGMVALDAEVKQLVKRVERNDDILLNHAERISRIETFVEIASNKKKLGN